MSCLNCGRVGWFSNHQTFSISNIHVFGFRSFMLNNRWLNKHYWCPIMNSFSVFLIVFRFFILISFWFLEITWIYNSKILYIFQKPLQKTSVQRSIDLQILCVCTTFDLRKKNSLLPFFFKPSKFSSSEHNGLINSLCKISVFIISPHYSF